MFKKPDFRLIALLTLLFALMLTYTSCNPGMTETPAEEEAPAKEEATAEVPPVEVAAEQEIEIQYSMIQMVNPSVDQSLSASFLEGGFDRAQMSQDLADYVIVTQQVPPTSPAAGCLNAVDFLPPDGIDLFMMSSHTIPYISKSDTTFVSPPEYLVEEDSVRPFPFQVDAFTDPNSPSILALPIATMPMMLIYNPDLLGVLTPTISLDDVINIGRNGYKLGLPEHMGIGGATFQALGGDNFSEEASLDPEFILQYVKHADKFDILAQEELIYMATNDQLIEDFISESLAWTLHDSSFLLRLARADYLGNLDVRPFPSIDDQGISGTSAMSWAWSVPAESPYQEISWKLARNLSTDPGQLQWLLSQGMLPATEVGFDQLRIDPNLADGFFPQYFIDNTEVLDRLQSIVKISKPWRIPPQISPADYNEIVVPTTLELISNFVNRQLNFSETIDTYLEKLKLLE